MEMSARWHNAKSIKVVRFEDFALPRMTANDDTTFKNKCLIIIHFLYCSMIISFGKIYMFKIYNNNNKVYFRQDVVHIYT